MSIKFDCGSCGKRLVVPDEAAGRKGKCPACGHTQRVPEFLFEDEEDEDPPPRRKVTTAKTGGPSDALRDQIDEWSTNASRYDWHERPYLDDLLDQLSKASGTPAIVRVAAEFAEKLNKEHYEASGRLFLNRDYHRVVWQALGLVLRKAADMDAFVAAYAPLVFSNIERCGLLDSFADYMYYQGHASACPKTTAYILQYAGTIDYAPGLERLLSALEALGRAEEARRIRARNA